MSSDMVPISRNATMPAMSDPTLSGGFDWTLATARSSSSSTSQLPVVRVASPSRQTSLSSRTNASRRPYSSSLGIAGTLNTSMLPHNGLGQSTSATFIGQNNQHTSIPQTPSPPPLANSQSYRPTTSSRGSGIALGAFGTLGVSSPSSTLPTSGSSGMFCQGGRASRERAAPGGSTGGQRMAAGLTPSNIGFSSPQSAYQNRSFNQSVGQDHSSELELKEWSFFGVDIVISDIASLAGRNVLAASSLLSGEPITSRDDRSYSRIGAPELFTASFGGDRWKLEILKQSVSRTKLDQDPVSTALPRSSEGDHPDQVETKGFTESANEDLSLYLSCNILDTAHFSPDVIPTTLMFGIREAGEQVGKRGARGGWLWRVWEDEWCFGTGTEYWECHNFPSFSKLLENPRIKELDSFVLSVQIQSPVRGTMPMRRDSHHVPSPSLPTPYTFTLQSDLLTGVESLLDDPSTGDVIIYVHEKRAPALLHGKVDSNLSSTAETPAESLELYNYRKRAFYAHSGILKARSAYFQDMLNCGWAEKAGPSERGVIKIEDFDFITIFWLLKYLYTNEITFLPVEDVRLLSPNELPEGWLGASDRLHWDWLTTEAITTLIEMDRWESDVKYGQGLDTVGNGRSLSAIDEVETPPNGNDSVASNVIVNKEASCIGINETGNVARQATRVSAGSKAASTAVDSSLSHPRRTLTPEPTSPSRSVPSAAGRISPLGGIGGRPCPKRASYQNYGAISSRRSEPRRNGELIKDENSLNTNKSPTTAGPNLIRNKNVSFSIEEDPHKHPTEGPDSPASALAIYRVAHRYQLHSLSEIARDHLISTLCPSTAFPLLLSTHLWPELHSAIKKYALSNYYAILHHPEFKRCYAEVGEGLWEHGGEVLHDFTLMLTPASGN